MILYFCPDTMRFPMTSSFGHNARAADSLSTATCSLFALSVQLGDKPYLMGDKPCGTDATAFGALAGILTISRTGRRY